MAVASRARHLFGALAAVLGVFPSACRMRPPCDGVACAPACPRDASRSASGRCACIAGDAIVLGACVPPAIADAYCGPSARFGADGCAFRACPEDGVRDAATGACVPRSTGAGPSSGACGAGGAAIIAHGQPACVPPDAACPRGTRRAGAWCARPPQCPPGALLSGQICLPIVTVGVHDEVPRVDLGAWIALVLGVDGGPGTSDLCRPLSLRPDAFAVAEGTSGILSLRIRVVAPDQDLANVHADVHAELREEGAIRGLSGEAESLIRAAVMTLIEPLRGLGGEASTAMVELRVTCGLPRL